MTLISFSSFPSSCSSYPAFVFSDTGEASAGVVEGAGRQREADRDGRNAGQVRQGAQAGGRHRQAGKGEGH